MFSQQLLKAFETSEMVWPYTKYLCLVPQRSRKGMRGGCTGCAAAADPFRDVSMRVRVDVLYNLNGIIEIVAMPPQMLPRRRESSSPVSRFPEVSSGF